MYIFSVMTDKDLGNLHIVWDSKFLYLSARDLATLLQVPIRSFLREYFSKDIGSKVIALKGNIYLESNAILQILSEHNEDIFQQVYQWIQGYFIPQIRW